MSTVDHEGPVEVPEEWVMEFEGSDEAEAIRRLEGDAELVADLHLVGFRGPKWERMAETLARYGYSVITTWLYTEAIFERVVEKGLGLYLTGGREVVVPPGSEIDDIVQDTMIEAIQHFRDDVLRPGKWDPAKGASLKTFFIGQALIRFTGVYRRWLEDWSRRRRSVHRVDARQLLSGMRGTHTYEQPEAMALLRDEVSTVISSFPSREAYREAVGMFVLRSQGWSVSEIAEVFGITESKVKTTIHRVRKHRRETYERLQQADGELREQAG